MYVRYGRGNGSVGETTLKRKKREKVYLEKKILVQYEKYTARRTGTERW